MTASFKQNITQGDLLVGTIQTLPSPEITEIIRNAGSDWLFIPMEHSTLSIKDAQAILQAAGDALPCIIRIPSLGEVWVKKSLDIGATGIMVPQIKSAKDVEQLIQFAKYPPLGNRSVGIARAQGYGAHFQTYIENANNKTVIIPQIEHIDAVENISEILQVPGIDAILVGPYDLSGSMRKIGQVADPAVQAAILHVKTEAERYNIPIGIFAPTEAKAKQRIDEGYKLIVVGIDTMLFSHRLDEMLSTIKEQQ